MEELNVGTAAGWLSAAAVLIAGIGTAYKVWHRLRQERDSSTIGQYRELCDRLQRQVDMQSKHIDVLTDAVSELVEGEGECRVDLAEMYGHLTLHHAYNTQVAAALRRLAPGEEHPDPPPLPERPRRPERDRSEFRKRTLQQQTATLQQLSGTIPQPPDLRRQ